MGQHCHLFVNIVGTGYLMYHWSLFPNPVVWSSTDLVVSKIDCHSPWILPYTSSLLLVVNTEPPVEVIVIKSSKGQERLFRDPLV